MRRHSERLRATPATIPGRRRVRRAVRPAVEALDERIVPSTFVGDEFGLGVSGISGGGTVWHYDSQRGWSQLGGLTGAVALISASNQLEQSVLFAEASNGQIWEYRFPTAEPGGGFPSGQ